MAEDLEEELMEAQAYMVKLGAKIYRLKSQRDEARDERDKLKAQVEDLKRQLKAAKD